MKTLIELFKEQGNTTDKLTNHQYPYLYEEMFDPVRDMVTSVLEIGIADGGSIRVWREYFHNATIFAVDIERGFVWGVEKLDRVEAYTLDAGNSQQLRSFVDWLHHRTDTIDLIIDDGSHKVFDILNAFSILWPEVTPGGVYIIEDVAQTNDSLALMGKAAQLAFDVLTNCSDALSCEFWPNMIVFTKKLEDDLRAPQMGTL